MEEQNSSPRIGITIGLNLPIEEGEAGRFNRITPSITISNIDPTGNVKEQLSVCKQAVVATWIQVSELLDESIKQELDRRVAKLRDLSAKPRK